MDNPYPSGVPSGSSGKRERCAMTKKWAKNAPDRLVRAYENREIGKGRDLLERLLRDERMKLTWAELARHVRTDQQWLRVWSAIVYAKSESNKAGRLRKQRGAERDDYQALARKFSALARKIENGPRDLLAYELLPQDVLAALHVSNLHDMDVIERCDVAHRLLPCWPSAPELLRGLEKFALAQAAHAMDKQRPEERGSGNVAARTFVWYLGQDFRTMFGKPLLGTLAKIADVTFDVDLDCEFTRSFVQGTLRGV